MLLVFLCIGAFVLGVDRLDKDLTIGQMQGKICHIAVVVVVVIFVIQP